MEGLIVVWVGWVVGEGRVLVRVGGGFMNIDDFIEQYTPLELEKIERKNALTRFSNKNCNSIIWNTN